jgi:plasmid stabilization system protein ParE
VIQVIVTPEALAHIEAIDAWWTLNRSAAPELFREELASGLELIGSAPRIGRRQHSSVVPGLRRVLLRASRYHLYYVHVVAQRIVFVLAVWSAHRGHKPDLRPVKLP